MKILTLFMALALASQVFSLDQRAYDAGRAVGLELGHLCRAKGNNLPTMRGMELIIQAQYEAHGGKHDRESWERGFSVAFGEGFVMEPAPRK